MSRLYLALRWITPPLLLLSSVRVLLWIQHRNSFFRDLDLVEVLSAHLVGLRFDLSFVLTFWGFPCLLMLALPCDALGRVLPWIRVQLVIQIVFLAAILGGDFLYFGTTGRHMTDELLSLGNDWQMLLDLAFGVYAPLGAGIVTVIALSWRNIAPVAREQRPAHFGSFALALLVCVTGIRGLGLKPLNIADAFSRPKGSYGQLVLSGGFSSWHSVRVRDQGLFPPLTQAQIHERLQPWVDFSLQYPFFHPAPPVSGTIKNIVLILLESWQACDVPGFGAKSATLMPRFADLSRQGLRFQRFYASGSRSIEAIQGLLTSFPPLKGLPTLSLGFEALGISRLGAALAARGMRTTFSQSAQRDSFRLAAVARSLGFEIVRGSEDFPRLLSYDDRDPLFGWDHEHLQAMIPEWNRLEQPFFAFLFTGTTHTPFRRPPRPFHLSGASEENRLGFENTLHYADWALGEFWDQAKRQSWFRNTLFAFVADHTYPAFGEVDAAERQRVPFLIVAGDGSLPSRDLTTLGSHVDVMPTLFALAGQPVAWAHLGRDLLGPQQHDNFVFLSGRYDNPGLITRDGMFRHDGTKVLDPDFAAHCDRACQLGWEQVLHALDAGLRHFLRHNQWQPQI